MQENLETTQLLIDVLICEEYKMHDGAIMEVLMYLRNDNLKEELMLWLLENYDNNVQLKQNDIVEKAIDIAYSHGITRQSIEEEAQRKKLEEQE